jgi:hypothetical protein
MQQQQRKTIPEASEAELRALEKVLLSQENNRKIAVTLERIHTELASREFPKLEYLSYIKENYHDQGVNSYLEVGVRWGDGLALAKPDCKSVGVDPNFQINKDLPSDPSLFEITSDDFFFEHSDTYKNFFELIFLDGLHEARQTAKDIYHSLDVLKEGGEILVHDVLPVTMAVASPEMKTYFWTGNVWQSAAAFCRKEYPLKWEFIDAAPSGLLRLYDIDPEFRPSRKEIMQNVATASKMHFEARELLDYLRSL